VSATSDCLFCKVAAGEIPADVVRRTDRFVAFRDINPQAPTHVLVIPTDHVRSLNEATDAKVLGDLLLFARDTAREEGLADRGYRVVLNTNADGGQTVFHLHAHVLGGRRLTWPPG
jgi:histidine triad (HIT) family protein